jgi:thymidylate synthase (FAD)
MNVLRNSLKVKSILPILSKRNNFLDFPDKKSITNLVINLENKMVNIGTNGFVRLVDCMPRTIPDNCKHLMCDHAIVQAARVSFDEGLKTREQDIRLIDFLIRHKHTSPFEMVKFKFHIKAPIFVQRQWIRHRTANVNEISGRYSVLKPEFYIPDKIYDQGKLNKQMSGNEINNKNTKEIFDEYMRQSVKMYSMYKRLVEHGVSRETSRIGLPVNMYTEFYWCIDLHNLMNFIKLRSADNAQSEIKEYSDSMKYLISDLCPNTISSFEKHFKP